MDGAEEIQLSTITTAHIAQDAEQEIRPIWSEYQKADSAHQSAGARLGHVLLKWHLQYKQQGSRTGGGFDALLKQLGIPKATAYRRMRAADPNFVSPDTKSPSPKWKPARRMNKKGFNRRIQHVFMQLLGVTDALADMDINAGPLLPNDNDLERYLETGRTVQKHLSVLMRRLRTQKRSQEAKASDVIPAPATNLEEQTAVGGIQ